MLTNLQEDRMVSARSRCNSMQSPRLNANHEHPIGSHGDGLPSVP